MGQKVKTNWIVAGPALTAETGSGLRSPPPVQRTSPSPIKGDIILQF